MKWIPLESEMFPGLFLAHCKPTASTVFLRIDTTLESMSHNIIRGAEWNKRRPQINTPRPACAKYDVIVDTHIQLYMDKIIIGSTVMEDSSFFHIHEVISFTIVLTLRMYEVTANQKNSKHCSRRGQYLPKLMLPIVSYYFVCFSTSFCKSHCYEPEQ